VRPGTDLGRELVGAIRASGLDLKDGDVVVVASKIVAKAEGALASAGSRAELEALVTARTRHTVARRRFGAGATVSVVRTPAGTVQAAAGLDRSNTESAGDVVLHPQDPDASAAALLAVLTERFGARSSSPTRPHGRGAPAWATSRWAARGWSRSTRSRGCRTTPAAPRR
jgi:coenzyme F420-0:L-glutamate ligase/coenzyme F420-1:gamma-L-glutamate ligase